MVVVSFAVAYALATGLAVLVTWRALRARVGRSAIWLAVATAGVSWWSFVKFLEVLVFEQSVRYVFTALHWVGVGVVSIGILGFGLALTGRTGWLTRPRIAALSVVPVLPVVAWLGDPRAVAVLGTATPLPQTLLTAFEAVETTWPWLRWISLAYLWLLVATGSVFVLEAALERPKLDPSRGLLVVMVTVPWAVNISYEFGVIPYTGFDPTVLGFLVAGVAGLAAIDRFRLFDVPFARSQVVQEFSTAVLVYGPDRRLYDYNQRAAGLLDVDAADLGTDIRSVLADTPVPVPDEGVEADGALTAALDGTHVPIQESDDESRHVLVQASALGDDRTQHVGYTLQVTDITEQYQQREQIRRERNLKELIRNVLVQLSARDDLERAFCEHLAAEDRYSVVGICERATDGGLSVRTVASDHDGANGTGVDGYDALEALAEPGRSALETGDLTVERGISAGAAEDDTAAGSAVDIEAVAAVPITHNDLTYGVLVVCSPRSDTFDTGERQLLAELGESVAFSINVAEQREALRGEAVREVVFEVSDPDHHLLSLATGVERSDTDPKIEVFDVGSDTDVETGTGSDAAESGQASQLQFLTIEGVSGETAVTRLRAHSDVESATVLLDDAETTSVRVLVRRPSIGSLLTGLGAVVRSVEVTEGAITAVAEFSTRTDMNRVLARLRDRYPETGILSLVTREPDPLEPDSHGEVPLTSKQRKAIAAAYHAGFFERPQRQTAEEIAEDLGVSRATFLRHVRAAEANLVEAVLTDHERPLPKTPD